VNAPQVLQAVLFDMDGLLVSTEHTWFEVETELMRELGSAWGPEHQAALVGGPLDHSAQYMLDVTGRTDISAESIAVALLNGMETKIRRGPVAWMPGAQELLVEVTSAGIPAGLVSSSYRRVMDAVLDAVGRERFTATVSADDVLRTKPHPDPYLAGARALRVDPARCVALEDSATGATSARAAGCITVAVPSVASVDPSIPHTVIGSLADIDLAWLHRLVDQHMAA
jgi:HAD superfamily hydrolase (TIGR01509 family)